MRFSPSPRFLTTLVAIFLLAVSSAPPLAAADPSDPPIPASPAAFSCDNVTEIPKSECEALVALYNSTNGPNWTDNTGWLQTNSPCSWLGVGCWPQGVRYLLLYRNKLSGPIPPELGSLSILADLRLEENGLSGLIPPQLGNLTQLQELFLYNNQLSGNIPPQLGGLANLQILYLSDNQLNGSIPPEFGSLTALKYLNLSRNQLRGPIPPQLAGLTNLRFLFLSTNLLSGPIPLEFAGLRSPQNTNLPKSNLYSTSPSTLSALTLSDFWYDQTDLCEPGDAAFQTWLHSVAVRFGTDVVCGSHTISGLIWDDANRNGIQDPGETGLEGATLTLTQTKAAASIDAAGRRIFTDADGNYRFDYVATGVYALTFSKPGYLPSTSASSPINISAAGDVTVPPIGLAWAPAHVYLSLLSR